MTIPVQDRLYKLLPSLYRIRDNEPGQAEALRALMALIEEQFLAIEADVDQLYDDAFIETCQEWVVPYLGDLLGVSALQDTAQQGEVQTASQVSGETTNGQAPPYSRRAFVANTLAYRQRKGTATVLEQLARDVTNWPARVVEYFQRLEWTQHTNHLRPRSWRTPDLRETTSLDLLNTPFETAQHTPEVRHIDSPLPHGKGRYNLGHVGIHLWRLQAYPLEKVQPRPALPALPQSGLYHIDPLGRDQALFNPPEPEANITSLATEINVPAPLRRRPLYDEIEARIAGQTPLTQYFGEQPPFQIYLNNETKPVAPADLMICDLSGEPGAADSNWQRPDPASLIESNAVARRIAIDPQLSRLAIPLGQAIPETIRVSYAYGFSGDIGGGAYDRRASRTQALSKEATWEVGVSSTQTPVGDEAIFPSLSEAIAQWNTQPAGTRGTIILMDNTSYTPGSADIKIPDGSELLIVAADWPPITLTPASLGQVRQKGQWVPIGQRAHVDGPLTVQGTGSTPNPGRLILDGLLIEGLLTLQPGNLEQLRIAHCTLVPEQGGLKGSLDLPPEDPTDDAEERPEDFTNSRLTIDIDHSITGPVYVPQTVGAIAINDSIVDANTGLVWITSSLPPLSTAGELQVVQMDGSESTLSIPAEATPSDLQADLEVAFQLIPGLEGVQVGLQGDRLIFVSQTPLTFKATAEDAETVNRLGLLAGAAAIASPDPAQAGPALTIESSTVFGSSYVQAFQSASEVIFTGSAIAQRRQIGCVRFSYVPPGSRTPRRYRCQPDLTDESDPDNTRVIVPGFTSRDYESPAYGQLSQSCPEPIRTGAENGSEMGAFSFLNQPLRDANLRSLLDEYLRFGLEAGIFYVN